MILTKEAQFKNIVRNWLEKQGYVLRSMILPLDSSQEAICKEAYNHLYRLDERFYVSEYYPEGLFVKRSKGYPDIIGVKDGKAFAFEVKVNLEHEHLDRCIGQCLRYLTTESWVDRICVVVPTGAKNLSSLRDIISKFLLPIDILEL